MWQQCTLSTKQIKPLVTFCIFSTVFIKLIWSLPLVRPCYKLCYFRCMWRPLPLRSCTAAFVWTAFLSTLHYSSWFFWWFLFFLVDVVTAAAKRFVKQVQSCPDAGGGWIRRRGYGSRPVHCLNPVLQHDKQTVCFSRLTRRQQRGRRCNTARASCSASCC